MAYPNEARAGKVVLICRQEDVSQQAPDGYLASEYDNWQAIEQSAYEYQQPHYGAGRAPDPEPDTYAYTVGVGQAQDGLVQRAADIIQPFDPANAIAFQENWYYTNPALTNPNPYYPIRVDEIPTDAWIERVDFTIRNQKRWAEHRFTVSVFEHNHSLLPQPTGLILSDFTDLTTGDFGELLESLVVDPNVTFIDAQAAINELFEVKFGLSYINTAGYKKPSPWAKLAYIAVEVYWRAPDTIAIESWEGAELPFSMALTGDIKIYRPVAFGLDCSMTLDGNVNFIGNLDGEYAPGMTLVGDITADYGGVDTGIHNTAVWYPSLTLSAAVSTKKPLATDVSDIAVPWAMDLAGDLQPERNLSGTFTITQTYEDLGLRRVPALWVAEDGAVNEMLLTGDITRAMKIDGATSWAMSMAGSIYTIKGLTGGLSGSMALTGDIARTRGLGGTLVASMSGVGAISRGLPLSGTLYGSLDWWAGITYLYNEPALEDNTLRMAAINRTIYLQNEQRVIDLQAGNRTIFMTSRSTDIEP